MDEAKIARAVALYCATKFLGDMVKGGIPIKPNEDRVIEAARKFEKYIGI